MKRTAAETKSWVTFVFPLPNTGRCGFLGHWVKGENAHWLRWVKFLPTGQQAWKNCAGQSRPQNLSSFILLRVSGWFTTTWIYGLFHPVENSSKSGLGWGYTSISGLFTSSGGYFVLGGTLKILETGEKYGAKQNILIEKMQVGFFFFF